MKLNKILKQKTNVILKINKGKYVFLEKTKNSHNFFFLYWSLADLQCHVSFRYTTQRLSYIFFFRSFPLVLLLISHPVNSLQPHGLQHWTSVSLSQSLLKLKLIELEIPSNHLILSHPRLLLPSVCPSIRVFSNESVLCIRWPKYWSFSFSISPSNEYSGLIFLRMDWFFSVQGSLKSLLQHYSSKASILQRSAFLMVQLSHSYMTKGKTIALSRWTFVGKVLSLLFNMLSRLAIAFLPGSKHLLIS